MQHFTGNEEENWKEIEEASARSERRQVLVSVIYSCMSSSKLRQRPLPYREPIKWKIRIAVWCHFTVLPLLSEPMSAL
jgi:hypothetical protein